MQFEGPLRSQLIDLTHGASCDAYSTALIVVLVHHDENWEHLGVIEWPTANVLDSFATVVSASLHAGWGGDLR